MKKIYKILSYTLLSIILIAIVGVLATKYYVANNWKNYYSEDEMNAFGKTIDNTPSLSENFYKAHELIYPNQTSHNISEMENIVLWNILTLNEEKLKEIRQCNCVLIAENFENRFPHKFYGFSWLMLAHGLEQKSSELKCLDYFYTNNNYIRNLSHEFFDKPINVLSFRESVELIIMFKNPTAYIGNEEKLKNEVNNYLKNLDTRMLK